MVVWRRDENGKWVKELANIDNKLSVITGIWAPNGKKFAIGSSDKICSIGFFNPDEKFWSAKMLLFKK